MIGHVYKTELIMTSNHRYIMYSGRHIIIIKNLSNNIIANNVKSLSKNKLESYTLISQYI
jgi:hypothetical protein